LGAHPDDGEQVAIYNGPYGHYVKHGKVNASLPEGKTPDDINLELALELLAAKAGTKKKTTRKKSSTTAKKTTKRAAASKKTTAKKTTAKKTTAKKTTRAKKTEE
jgi:DNA topoisomerase-1